MPRLSFAVPVILSIRPRFVGPGRWKAKAAARLDNALRHFLFSGLVTLSAAGRWTR